MARLNEPPMSADSMESLRRKLLRQNRDLAKTNAAHLSRIRTLEADFARCLSENLELNGRIIELEKELEDSNTRRIADHALDVRSRLEAQLMECMSVLAGLGQEPPSKRHASPRGRRSSRASLPRRSPPQRRPPREIVKDTVARALQEGRLPPISENKSYPRATLDREQILALCSEAADTTDTTDSPELGPPPMSRFVDGESIDTRSPSRSREYTEPKPAVDSSPIASLSPVPASPISSPKPASKPEKNLVVRPDPIDETENDVPQPKPRIKETPILPPVPPYAPAKAGSKRKYSVGEDAIKAKPPTIESPQSKDNGERPVVGRDRQNMKTLKELANMRREARERMAAPVNPRKPLSAKSTNDDVTSPVKQAKATAEDKDTAEKLKPRAARQRAVQKMREAEVEVETETETGRVEVHLASPSPPAPVVDILPPTENVLTEAALLSPASPEPTSRMSLSSVRDTPPPADISSHGETSRPSRRARSSVSYAEPNLRDKMRRPTKELYDAVSGQTRYLQRSGSVNSDTAPSDEALPVKHESSDSDAWRHLSNAASPSSSSRRRTDNPSQLADNMRPFEPSTSAAKPDRKKRSSSMMSKSISELEDERSIRQVLSQTVSPGRSTGGRPTPPLERESDPYEFPNSTTLSSDTPDAVEPKENARQSKSSRRLSSVVKEDFKVDSTEGAERPRTAAPRKRASMVLPKRTHTETEGPEDSSFESLEGGDLQDVRSRVSMRRRSMML